MSFAQKVIDEKLKVSVAPLGGYDTTYGAFFGVGFFTDKDDQFSTSLLFIYTVKDVIRIEPGFVIKFNDQYSLEGDYQYNNGFEPFYGVTNHSKVDDVQNIFGYKLVTRTGLKRKFDPYFSSTFYVPIFYWNPNHPRNTPETKLLIPKESHAGVEWVNLYDRSVKKVGLTSGWSFSNDSQVYFNPNTIVRTEVEYKYFLPVGERVGFAFHTMGGLSYGKRDYFDNNFLGGTARLRGYLKNRFVGEHYLVQQNEIRFPLFIKNLSAITFSDFGEVFNYGESPFLKFSEGFGLRYALPPDHLEMIRIDVGFSKDQWGVFFDFAQAF